MKHLITSILLLLAFLLPVSAAAYDFEVDGIYYNINGNKATVTSGTNSYSGDVAIPSTVTYNGTTYSVTTIGAWSFESCDGLTGVTIPNSVTTIGNGAFWGCSNLKSVTIPNSVTKIEVQGFAYCRGLTSIAIPSSVVFIDEDAFGCCTSLKSMTVDSGNPVYDSRDNCNAIIKTSSNTLLYGCQTTLIPNTVTTIGSWAFQYCNGLTSVTIPNSVTVIRDHAFLYCSGLSSITIPNSVTTLGNFAFSGCSGLSSVFLPKSVKSMGYNPFSSCEGLTSIRVDSSNPVYDSRDNCNAIIETASNTMLSGCQNTVIPNTVTALGRDVFSQCTNLTSISIPNSVTSIGTYAFNHCTGLKDVYSYITDLTNVSVGESSFSLILDNYSGRTLHVLRGMADAYLADGKWYPYFGKIVDDLMSDYLRGDINQNGVVEITDVACLIDKLLYANGDMLCDVDQNGVVNIDDVTYLIDYIITGSWSDEPEEHEYVDLGLPSGTLWATCNVGANSPEEYGDYFAWGEVTPKEVYNWSTYQWCNGSMYSLTKYNTNNRLGIVDNKTVLEPEDDAASVNWGPSWCTPTEEQQKELYEKCSWVRTKVNGVNGFRVIGPNGNALFLPAAGYCSDSSLEAPGSYGSYWSRSCYTSNGISTNAFSAADMGFNWTEWSTYLNGSYHFRYYGHSVRAVRTPQN